MAASEVEFVDLSFSGSVSFRATRVSTWLYISMFFFWGKVGTRRPAMNSSEAGYETLDQVREEGLEQFG